MPDTPFKSMTREPGPKFPSYEASLDIGEGVRCDRCGHLIFTGDWPWCRGNQEDHDR